MPVVLGAQAQISDGAGGSDTYCGSLLRAENWTFSGLDDGDPELVFYALSHRATRP